MSKKITSCSVRMYTMGTGDCFVLSFKDDNDATCFKLMIDCGAIYLGKDKAKDFATEIVDHTNGKVDVLLITHEHKDHVVGFEMAKDIFVNNLTINELWLPWTEDDRDRLVRRWKKEYGKKKRALAFASNLLNEKMKDSLFEEVYNHGLEGEQSMKIRAKFSETLVKFRELNTSPFAASSEYKGGLKGMNIIKEKMKGKPTRYLKTGSILENIDGLDNIRIYILGPPRMWRRVKKEHGKDGETYKHNKEIELVRGFSALPFDEEDNTSHPFDQRHIAKTCTSTEELKKLYEKDSYRRIDFDWLFSAGNLSLRLTEGINNLSAVLAIEFIDSGKVMLFPADAEFGSWESWHKIKWDQKGKDGETHLTTDLLNRTVFYKVAHHMSHNGTAKEKGLNLMTSDEFAAMGPLDYKVISENWRNTMPNREIVRNLLDKTKGKLIISNLDGIYYDKDRERELKVEIEERRSNLNQMEKDELKKNLTRKDTFVEYIVNGK